MRFARLFAACLLGAGISMFTSCGSFQFGSAVGASELPAGVRSERTAFFIEKVPAAAH